MPFAQIDHLDRLAIHTITNKPWSLVECVEAYAAAGIAGISVWRNVIEPIGIAEAARIVHASGLRVPALVRGGFFPALDASDRRKAIDDNLRCIDEAAAIGAEMIVLVVGAVPGMALDVARTQVAEGIAACADRAAAAGVKLAIEPMHPMYAADRSCINRMTDARLLCDRLDHPAVGLVVDVYHVWWDTDLQREIDLAGASGRLMGFHVCDWRVPTRDLVNDRAVMGDGCIDIRRIRGWMESAGFAGLIEVEIFSDEYWAQDQRAYLDRIVRAYGEHV